MGNFSDVAEPTASLVAPTVDGDADEPSMAYREFTKYGDPLSPSWVASKGIEIFCGWFGLDFNPHGRSQEGPGRKLGGVRPVRRGLGFTR
jgi:hypothetical protein